jgi:hypothetical protein
VLMVLIKIIVLNIQIIKKNRYKIYIKH